MNFEHFVSFVEQQHPYCLIFRYICLFCCDKISLLVTCTSVF